MLKLLLTCLLINLPSKVGLRVSPYENGIITRQEIKIKVEELVGDGSLRARALNLKEVALKSVREGCEYLGLQTHYSTDLEPVWPKAHDVKRPKLTYRIKTRHELSRRKSLKPHLRKLGCLVKDLLHGGPSRILSLSTGNPTAYGMFVKDNTKKVFIHGFPSF